MVSDFDKFPQLMKMNQLQSEAYLHKLEQFLDEIDGLAIERIFSRIHDFVLENAAQICHQQADAAHSKLWDLKNDLDHAIVTGNRQKSEALAIIMAGCEAHRESATACKKEIRRHMYAATSIQIPLRRQDANAH